MNDTPTPRTLPLAAEFVLTRRVPCAVLVTCLFEAPLWLAGTALSLPFLVLHLLTPALFAVITLGGGMGFAAQVGGLAALLATLLAHFSLQPGLLLVTLYAALPILATGVLARENGMERSAVHLAIGLATAMLAMLVMGAIQQHVGVQEVVGRVLEPLFTGMTEAQKASGGTVDPEVLNRLRTTMILIFPGSVALSLWIVWWGDVMLGRTIATYYGFYEGDQRPLSLIHFGSRMAYLFVALTAVALIASGSVKYVAINGALLVSGLLAAQGLAVTHVWLRARQMPFLTALVYFLLLIQPAMVLPFVVIGLFDTRFDYRRKYMPASGGK
ncbi:MAG TPA: DUF2232 domain-containing protein [Mariprofundaceae bacterium]|nr:DUF2232 domain-containing protein [Mariprofundaceae bacterium]